VNLWLRTPAGDAPFTTCAAQFAISEEAHEPLVGVRCRLVDLGLETQALLDTGAEWSVVGGDMADALSLTGGAPMTMSTRFGKISGELHKIRFELLAEKGDSLEVQATAFVAAGFPRDLVIGFRGFLESLRFALSPAVASGERNWFLFGSA
jgi:hypothetical protein